MTSGLALHTGKSFRLEGKASRRSLKGTQNRVPATGHCPAQQEASMTAVSVHNPLCSLYDLEDRCTKQYLSTCVAGSPMHKNATWIITRGAGAL